jgi:hypothetical protein
VDRSAKPAPEIDLYVFLILVDSCLAKQPLLAGNVVPHSPQLEHRAAAHRSAETAWLQNPTVWLQNPTVWPTQAVCSKGAGVKAAGAGPEYNWNKALAARGSRIVALGAPPS